MSRNPSGRTRRGVLRAAGGSLAAVGATGLVGATPDETVEANVGYSAEPGRQAALAAADQVVREFAFDALTVRLPERAMDRLAARSDVRYVEENRVQHAALDELTWGMDRVDADFAHREGVDGAGVDVAIIDSGIDSDHPDDEHKLGTGKAFVDCSDGCICTFGCEDGNGNACNDPWDDNLDHGTHVAGIAGAVINGAGVKGVATDVTLHAVKVLGSNGCGDPSTAAKGLEWATDRGHEVANMSLGFDHSDCLQDAVQYADGNGMLVVAAAGNDGCSDCVNYPAAYAEAVAVSATTPDDSLAGYSSTGPEVEFATPGGALDGDDSTSVYSTVAGEYDYKQGTSMASPHVAGAAALLVANGDSQTEARDRLARTAEDVGLSSNEQGNGLLDVKAALVDQLLIVHTERPSSVGTSSATLVGDLVGVGEASSVDVYFEWGHDSYSNTTSVQTLTSTGTFDETISGLESDTFYKYRAVAEASDGDTDTGGEEVFNTDSDGLL